MTNDNTVAVSTSLLPSREKVDRPQAETDEGVIRNRKIPSTRRTKSFAKTLRTEPERKMWSILRHRRLDGAKFRRQVPIGPYIADFACFDVRLTVELDGSQHAGSARDRVRDKWLEDDRYCVLGFSNSDLTLHRNAVLETIWHHVQVQPHPSSVSASPSHLLPQGEKGVPTSSFVR